jgi:hypothetical protein
MTKYGFRKIFTTSNPGQYTAITEPVGSVCEFDSTALYDDFGTWVDNRGFLLCGNKPGEAWLLGDTLIAVSYEDEDVIEPTQWNTVVSKFTILYASQTMDATLKGYLRFDQFNEIGICEYANFTQDYDAVVDYIVSQEFMTYWIMYVRASERARFAPFIVDQDWLYSWATDLDDSASFAKLTDSRLLFSYTLYYPDRKDLVKDRITDPYWIEQFNNQWPDDPIVTMTPTPTITYTPEQTSTPTPSPSEDVQPTPEVSPTPSVDVEPTPEPSVDVTPTPSSEVEPTPEPSQM